MKGTDRKTYRHTQIQSYTGSQIFFFFLFEQGRVKGQRSVKNHHDDDTTTDKTRIAEPQTLFFFPLLCAFTTADQARQKDPAHSFVWENSYLNLK